jgi:hypothetical protein
VLTGADDDDANLGSGCCWFRVEIDEVRLSEVALAPCEFLPVPPCLVGVAERPWSRVKELYQAP